MAREILTKLGEDTDDKHCGSCGFHLRSSDKPKGREPFSCCDNGALYDGEQKTLLVVLGPRSKFVNAERSTECIEAEKRTKNIGAIARAAFEWLDDPMPESDEEFDSFMREQDERGNRP